MAAEAAAPFSSLVDPEYVQVVGNVDGMPVACLDIQGMQDRASSPTICE